MKYLIIGLLVAIGFSFIVDGILFSSKKPELPSQGLSFSVQNSLAKEQYPAELTLPSNQTTQTTNQGPELKKEEKFTFPSSFATKVLIVNFWANWCKYCLDEMPSLNQFYNTYKSKGVDVWAINLDSPENRQKAFQKQEKLGISFPLLAPKATDLETNDYLKTSTLPVTFIYQISSTGLILKEKIRGTIDFQEDTFIQKIESLLR